MVVHVCTSSRSRVTLVQTKSGEHWDDAGEHWDGSHSGRSRPRNGDSVGYFHRRFSLLVSAWAALQIQALRASWDPLLDSNNRQLGPWSVEDKTFSRFSKHRLLQRRKQQHCRRQRRHAKHVLLVLVLARRLETRRRSPRRSTRLIVATLHEKILRSDTHWIAVRTQAGRVARIDRQSHTFEWGDGPIQYIVREG